MSTQGREGVGIVEQRDSGTVAYFCNDYRNIAVPALFWDSVRVWDTLP